MVEVALVVVGALAALAFVLAPLLRSEADLKSLRRARPGTRHLHGLESVEVELRSPSERRCHHCGAPVDAGYDFCGNCVEPLP
jgi:hypothetical protein